MPLTEHQAQQVTLVRVLEQTPNNGSVWSASDAKEATRAARDLVGTRASFTEFVARRAQWALEEINRRSPDRAFNLQAPKWPLVAGQAIFAIAILAGFCAHLLGTLLMPGYVYGYMHVIQPAVLALIGWNLFFFGWFFFQWILHLFKGHKKPTGPLIELFGRLRASESLGFDKVRRTPWVTSFKETWSQLSGPINEARLKMVASMASLFFTAGAMVGLIAQGFGKEIRMGWATTYPWINGTSMHCVVSRVLAPGAWLTNIPIPDAQHINSWRLPLSNEEVAYKWLYLYVASVLAWVIIPRLYLVALNAFSRWRMCRDFPLPMNGAYFTTLRAAWRGQRIGVSVVPFRYELSPALRSNLGAMLERIYGLAVDITVEQAVLMGEDATDWKKTVKREGHVAVIVIFNLAATAEADAHGALLQRLRKSIEDGTPVVPIVDTGAYRQDDPERFRQRCNQWRQILDRLKFKPLFLDLHKAAEDDLKTLDNRLNQDD
ncbi:MAG: DUF2868 domain-containing protein [Comamonadaceae bacterium]|jgi:hypothetical protein|uniref:DUF2868 domain-containing protein n=1 Tax=Candidatus Skiveiella danica TaxID=3386177 RepID=UPI001DAE9976|nr:DUF2868 domain-containing protein [Comamonadaceae bacterium]MBK6556372.1 DUF2868 domain-containing protein [Comamonadaceae bacterium]MBK7118192.1 DUF2868 domain-containing protein [Comamonadaceae bacterium]MBK9197640.1 DUF2868 domain-containing protein [Betaproteobacteria bacterium]MBK9987083.1 DUF2868 domain-containing protein [Betaproteobacteria bacterium]